MKVLVTGGNGQLGTSLRERTGEFPEYTFEFIDINDLDLTNADALKSFINASKPDLIINCAAYTAVDRAESEPDLAMAVNAGAPGMLSDICNKNGIHLVHISTDYVFDGKSYMPYSESDPVNPVSVYAKTKLEGEMRIVKGNAKGIIIRTSWLYSEVGRNFVKTIMKRGAESGTLRVVYDQIGSPTYAGDLAGAILEIVPKIMTIDRMEIFHYANEGVISWYDFAQAILEISNISCTLVPVETSLYPTPAARPAYSVFNKSKFREYLGKPIPYWRISLKKCIWNLSRG